VLLCGHCGSPLAQVEEQLKVERRRNERLRKIIGRKTEKERELESAYRTIAMQMKQELSEARKREVEGGWEKLRAELEGENRQLREEIAHLK
jgi:Skp family chaperone for outer membrane proteins